MKTQQLLPILAAAIGFAVAWAVKPTGYTAAPAAAEKSSSNKPAGGPQRSRTISMVEKRPKEVKAADFPLAELADQGPKTRGEAKMLRLSEALGLSIDQQGEIISAVEKAKTSASEDVPVIQDLASRGKTLEDALAKILTPEQLAKFEELRVRERENRIEARAQNSLAQIIEEIDLSPGQREEVLGRLRQYKKEQVQSVPASATLLLNTSMLPTDSKDLSMDGVLMLARLSEEPAAPENPMEAHQIIINRQRQELEEQLRCFDGVLTAAQMSQVHAAIAEKRATLDKLNRLPAPAAPGEKINQPRVPPAPATSPVIGPPTGG